MKNLNKLSRKTWMERETTDLIEMLEVCPTCGTFSRNDIILGKTQFLNKMPVQEAHEKKMLSREKEELFTTCIKALQEPPPNLESAPRVSSFTIYVDEKLNSLDKRIRALAEKCISNVFLTWKWTIKSITSPHHCHHSFNNSHLALAKVITYTCTIH